MTRSVAFFRNLNLGQGWAPTRPQLVAAFEVAGAWDVVNHQANGTVVYSSSDPARTAQEATATLGSETGFDDVVVVRTARWVAALADRLGRLEPCPAGEVVLHDVRGPLGFETPWTDGALTIVVADRWHAVTTFCSDSGRGSNAAVVLQRLTGVKGTARGVGTLLRLADRL